MKGWTTTPRRCCQKGPSQRMTESKPQLAVFYDLMAPSPLDIAASAQGLCSIVWVVGWAPDSRSSRVLDRFGTVVDLTDMTQIQAVARLRELGVEGIVVFDDAPLTSAAALAELLHLPFHSRHTAKLLSDKLCQRTALREAGLPVPAYAALQAGDDPTTGFPFPAVVKPRCGAGSRDTFRVEDAGVLSEILKLIDRDEQFIIEEWLTDRPDTRGFASDIVSVETIIRRGRPEHVAVTGRFRFAAPFRETGSFSPAQLSASEASAAQSLATDAIDGLGIRHGLVHTEIKFTTDGPRIVEVNGRLGGFVDHLLSRRGRSSMRTSAMRCALSLDVDCSAVTGPAVAYLYLIVPPVEATMLVAADHVAEVRKWHGVESVRLNRRPGDTLDFREGTFGYVAEVSGIVASHRELDELLLRIESTLVLSYSDG